MNQSAQAAHDERGTESLEIDLLLSGLARRYGYDFRDYARASLTRRIRNAMEAQGLGTVSELQARLLHDHDAMLQFVEGVSVRTTSMFRDPDVYQVLRRKVVPLLRTYPFVRIWVAGCATGEEVYSLAILLQEERLYERCRIYATDLSDGALESARKGIFPLRVMRAYTQAYERAGGREDFSQYYATDREHAVMRSPLRRNLIFSQHNLVCDAPFNEFHLIVCRNVTIYFNQLLRERVHMLFHDSLTHLGLLVLGKKETVRFTPQEHDYHELEPDSRVFRRVR